MKNSLLESSLLIIELFIWLIMKQICYILLLFLPDGYFPRSEMNNPYIISFNILGDEASHAYPDRKLSRLRYRKTRNFYESMW